MLEIDDTLCSKESELAMSAVNNHFFEICASDETKNEDETQITEYKKYLKSTSTHMRATHFRSEENIFMETEEKEKITSETSKNEPLDVECKRARNNNKGKAAEFNTDVFIVMGKVKCCTSACN